MSAKPALISLSLSPTRLSAGIFRKYVSMSSIAELEEYVKGVAKVYMFVTASKECRSWWKYVEVTCGHFSDAIHVYLGSF